MTRPLFRRLIPPRVREQLDDELALHRDMLIDQLVARGMTRADAAAAADRRLGNLNAIRSEAIMVGEQMERREQRTRFLAHLMQDLRFAVRGFRRTPGWTAVTLLTYALGVGAATAVFTVINSLLHPIPYHAADRVVQIYQTPVSATGSMFIPPSAALLSSWREHARTLEAVEPYVPQDMTLLQGGQPSSTSTMSVLPSFLRFGDIRLVAGRGLTDADAVPGAPHVVLLNENMWRSRFRVDPQIIGHDILLNGSPYTVVGIVSRAATVLGLSHPDAWLPYVADPRHPALSLQAIARLKPGISEAAAERELDALASVTSPDDAKDMRTRVLNPANTLELRQSFTLLAAAGIMVLLIACVNVAHLLLARGVTRRRELSIRVAVGAGRSRLFRQLFAESLLLAGTGATLGLALGWAGIPVLGALRPASMVELDVAHMDWHIFALSAATAVASGVLFGVLTMVQFGWRFPVPGSQPGSAAGNAGQHWLRTALVLSEMALATVLLISAVMLIRSIASVEKRPLGFDAAGVYAVRPVPLGSTYQPAAGFLDDLTARMKSLPGVRAVTLAANAPPSGGIMIGTPEAEGTPVRQNDRPLLFNAVQSDYFRFMAIPLIAGTTFTDTTSQFGQVVINQSLARRLWPTGSAVGRRIRLDPQQPWATVTGVTANIAQTGLIGMDDAPMIYTPRRPATRANILIRVTAGTDPVPAVRTLLASLDPHLPPSEIKSVEHTLSEQLARPQFIAMLLSLFTGIAVALAGVGLYGVIAHAVTQRTREIGIRVALGAPRRLLLQAVAGRMLIAATLGAALGTLSAHWTASVLSGVLPNIGTADPMSFVIGALTLTSVALLAGLVPARRALSIDPIRAIRTE